MVLQNSFTSIQAPGGIDADLFHARGRGAGAAVILRNMTVPEAVLLHKRDRLCKLPFSFRWETCCTKEQMIKEGLSRHRHANFGC